MAMFHETLCICTIYILFNQIAVHAYNLGHAQVRRKVPQNQAHLDPHINIHNNHLENKHDVNPSAIQRLPQHNPSNMLSNQALQKNLDNPVIFNLQPENDPVYHKGRHHESQINPKSQLHYKPDQLSNPAKFNIHVPNPRVVHPQEHDQPQRVRKINGIRMQRGGFGGSRQTFKHFRYSRIRRYYTLSTASMTTLIKLNYTTRLMYTTPTTRSTYRFTDPYIKSGSSRQTVLHTRMTESDEIGRDRFMSGSIEYKDDSFDRPPSAMVAYDSLQSDSTKNLTATTVVLPSASTVTKPITKSTKKISSELISLESSSEEKSSSSEAKDDESSSESEDYGTDKHYGEYGYHRKYNNTQDPFPFTTYPNLREVPGFSKENLTSAEIAYWEANASYIIENFIPPSEFQSLSNYSSDENLVRSFFQNENIEPHHLDFYKWYFKLLNDPERLRILYNRTVLEEPDYKNLSQFTPFAIPDDLQRYYMFISQMENEIDREKQQEERVINTQREAEQNLDRILGEGRPASPFKAPRFTKKQGDIDVSQILQMVDGPQSADSMMPGGVDSSEGFIDTSRYKREVSKFEPD